MKTNFSSILFLLFISIIAISLQSKEKQYKNVKYCQTIDYNKNGKCIIPDKFISFETNFSKHALCKLLFKINNNFQKLFETK